MLLLRASFGYLQVSTITNYFTDDGIAGYSIRFEDFTIWSAD